VVQKRKKDELLEQSHAREKGALDRIDELRASVVSQGMSPPDNLQNSMAALCALP